MSTYNFEAILHERSNRVASDKRTLQYLKKIIKHCCKNTHPFSIYFLLERKKKNWKRD